MNNGERGSGPLTFAGGWLHTYKGHQAAAFLADSPGGVICLCGKTLPTDHELSALPEDMVCQILNIVEAAPAATTYNFLWAHMLETPSLSEHEK